MRPAGEIRHALANAAELLVLERIAQPIVTVTGAKVAGGHWREIAQRACVGWDIARDTIKNMARAGHLRPLGFVRVSWSKRPLAVYAPAGYVMHESAPFALDDCMRSWLQH